MVKSLLAVLTVFSTLGLGAASFVHSGSREVWSPVNVSAPAAAVATRGEAEPRRGRLDCNGNGVPDDEDIANGTSQDCNANGVPDECDIANGTSQDCNENGVPDECDIANGTSLDENGNAVLDECEWLPEFVDAVSRAFSFLNRGWPTLEFSDAVSREFSFLNRGWPTLGFADAVSREFSFLNRDWPTLEFVDAVSREFSFQNEYFPPVLEFVDAVSREFSFENEYAAPLPDLVVTEVIGPVAATGGDTVVCEYAVQNVGTLAADATWRDAIYVSADELLDGGDSRRRLDPINVAPLEIGAVYARSRNVTLPVSYQGSAAYLIVVADAQAELDELEETNNLLASAPIDVAPTPAPDLVGGDVLAPPSAEFGATITVSWTGRNAGSAAATGPWTDNVYLSADPLLDVDDWYLGGAPITAAPLEPNVPPYAAALDVELPLDLETTNGSYYVLVNVDGNHAVDELDEQNVVAFGPVTLLLPPLPNLEANNVSGAAMVAAGEAAHISWNVANTGGAPSASSFVVAVYVSTDDQIGSDELLRTVAFSAPLSPGQSEPQSTDVIVPELAESSVYFAVCVDSTGIVLEADESDNCGLSGLATFDRPDLTVAPFDATANAVAGGTADIAWTVINTGPATAYPEWLDAVYLSQDAEPGADILLKTKLRSVPLASNGGQYSDVTGVVIPPTLAGEYYFIVQTDFGDRVMEGGLPANNFRVASAPTQMTQPPRPNLQVTALGTPGDALSGQPLNVQWTVTNVAAEGVAAGFWFDRVLASRDALPSAGDLLLGEFVHYGPLNPTQEYPELRTLEYPTAPGAWYLIVVADATDTVNEGTGGGEEDNVAASGAFGVTEFLVTTAAADADSYVQLGDPNTPLAVTITGQAVAGGARAPAPDVPVVLRITTRGFERRVTIRTDAGGAFVAVFGPGPTEGGLYELRGGPAHVATSALNLLDEFGVLALVPRPDDAFEKLVISVPRARALSLSNPGDVALTGLQWEALNVPAGLTVDVALPDGDDIPPLGSLRAVCTLTAGEQVSVPEAMIVRFSSAEGALAQVPFELEIGPPTPELQLVPEDLVNGQVQKSMVRGERTFAQFQLRNIGGAATEPLAVELPAAEWMSTAVATPLAPVAPAGETTVVLQLDPPADLTLGAHTGTLVIGGGTLSFVVPFRLIAVSTGIGDLRVRTTDEFTYYSPGEPPVVGADVQIYDSVTGALVAQGYTDTRAGEVLFEGLTEGYYDIETREADHHTLRSRKLVTAGQVEEVEAIMAYRGVRYYWSVVPSQYEDEYQIVITAEFQTFVPAPKVVIEPTAVDLTALTLPTQVNFTVTNYGWITAQNVTFGVQGNSQYELVPLITDLGDLPGGCTPDNTDGPCRVTVPVLVLPTDQREDDCDPLVVWECHEYPCGPGTITMCGPSILYQRDCPASQPTWGGGSSDDGGGPGGGGGGGGAILIPVEWVGGLDCDPCAFKCALGAAGCFPGMGGVMCGIGVAQNCVGGFDPDHLGQGIADCGGTLIDCFVRSMPVLGCACDVVTNCVLGCVDFPCSAGDVFTAAAGGMMGGRPARDTGDPVADFFMEQWDRVYAVYALLMHVYGTPEWVLYTEADLPTVAAWRGAFLDAAADESPEGAALSADEVSVLSGLPYSADITPEAIAAFALRWNRSVGYWAQGIYGPDDLPEGWDPDFVSPEYLDALLAALGSEEQQVIGEGFENLYDAFEYAWEVLIAYRAQQAYSAVGGGRSGDSVCATVRIEIDQTLTLTRSAFRATLTLENSGLDPLESIGVDLEIRDDAGQLTTSRFGLYPPELAGELTGVDGNGFLSGGTSGTASWLIVPTDEAAPTQPQAYFVSGTLYYQLGGNVASVPLYPVRIDVLPNPSLELKYFLERTVYSDDPFTPQLEPMQPFSLGVMVRNTGAGLARNLRIVSAQPEIIENEKGLVIDFDIIGTQLGLNEIAPSLTVQFGDIPGNSAAVARWLLTSTLQGEFVSFDASFEHVDALGDPRLSLIDSVDIFVLDHVVLADEPGSDGLPDFLTDDFPDFEDLPDRVHLSDGNVEPVEAVTDATSTTDPPLLRAEVLVPVMPGGWAYIKLADPYDAQYRLATAQRSDGKLLAVGYNVWQTNRINRALPNHPVERFLHIFDRGGDGHYTMTFFPDNEPPEAVAWDSVCTHGSGVGEIGLRISPPAPGSEPRAAGIGKLVVSFNEAVDPATFTAVNVLVDGFDLSGQDVDLSSITETVGLAVGDTVGIIEFSPVLPTGVRYCVALVGVTDRAGNPLGGDTFRVDLTSLPGDASGDRRVNNTDAGGVSTVLSEDPVDPDDLYRVRGDINLDGRVDAEDLAAVLAARRLTARHLPNPCLRGDLLAGPPAREGGSLALLNEGFSQLTVGPGDEFSLDLVLSAAPGEVHNSAIIDLIFTQPGLEFGNYTWQAPYEGTAPYDDSWPPSGTLPQLLDTSTLDGPGYPAGLVDVELSNVLFGQTFESGHLVSISLRVPGDFAYTGTIYVLVQPDTLANGFATLTVSGGPAFQLHVLAESPQPGDLNCDGVVDFGDINPFVLLLTNPIGYDLQYPNCRRRMGDINADGTVDFGDINPFVALLSGN